MLISGPEGDIEAVLETCLRESSSNWSGTGHVGPFLSAIRDLRSKHSQGMSNRGSRRKAVMNSLVVELCHIREEQERGLWKGIATLPIATVIEKLTNMSDEHLDAALGSLLQLPASYPHILNAPIHHFLRRAHSRLSHRERLTEPVVVAHIGYLIAKNEFAGAREILERFPARDQSALGGVVAYLRYVVDRPAHLSDRMSYSALSAEDLYLGVYYYPSWGSASPALTRQSQWDYGSLKNALLEKGPEGALNDFKVAGLQPRIAELVFGHVYGLLHDAKAQNQLRDTKRHSFPGFVFTDTDDGSCGWVYLGDYQPTASMRQTGDRVLPFCFHLPDSARYIQSSTDGDPGLGMELLNDP